jgi:biopolymer transport protein ExbD
MVFRARGKRESVALNVTSLIDVLFLLLIFFMLTGTFKRAGELELQLPDSSSSAPADEGAAAAQVELVATEDGRLLLDGEEVPLASLKGRLEARRADDPRGRVMIKAETGVPHGEVVRLLDIVRESGYAGVGIGTLIPSTGSGTPDR